MLSWQSHYTVKWRHGERKTVRQKNHTVQVLKTDRFYIYFTNIAGYHGIYIETFHAYNIINYSPNCVLFGFLCIFIWLSQYHAAKVPNKAVPRILLSIFIAYVDYFLCAFALLNYIQYFIASKIPQEVSIAKVWNFPIRRASHTSLRAYKDILNGRQASFWNNDIHV